MYSFLSALLYRGSPCSPFVMNLDPRRLIMGESAGERDPVLV